MANTSKADTDFIKALNAPHANIVLAMKPVYFMCTKTYKPDLEWKDIKQFMMKDFMKQVVELKTSEIPIGVKKNVLEKFINTP